MVVTAPSPRLGIVVVTVLVVGVESAVNFKALPVDAALVAALRENPPEIELVLGGIGVNDVVVIGAKAGGVPTPIKFDCHVVVAGGRSEYKLKNVLHGATIKDCIIYQTKLIVVQFTILKLNDRTVLTNILVSSNISFNFLNIIIKNYCETK